MTNYTPAQLEAWAGLGPWSYRSQEHDDWGIVRTGRYIVCQARDHRFMDDGYLNLCREEKRDPHEIPARLIAAAPDLARLVLEKEKEIARLRAALKPFVDATINADLKRLEHNDLFIRLTWPSSKGHTYYADMVPQRFIDARQAMKETTKGKTND